MLVRLLTVLSSGLKSTKLSTLRVKSLDRSVDSVNRRLCTSCSVTLKPDVAVVVEAATAEISSARVVVAAVAVISRLVAVAGFCCYSKRQSTMLN